MSPYAAYFLGLVTFLVILIPWMLLAQNSSAVASTYSPVFCSNLAAGA